MELQTIQFVDADSKNEATAIVRLVDGAVGLATFVVDGGECELYMSYEVCRQLQEALAKALAAVRT